MRVFIFTHWFPPNTTAPAFRAQSWAEGFSSVAREVIVITPYREGNESYPTLFQRRRILEERKGNLRIFQLPLAHHTFRNTIARMEPGWRKRIWMGLFFLLHHQPIHHSFDIDFNEFEGQIPHPSANDWVVSSGPPFGLHRLALRWKMLHGCRWLADYRDLWTVGRDRFRWGWMREWWQDRLNGEWERHWMHQADKIVTVGTALANDLRQQFPKVDVSVLENGALNDMKQVLAAFGEGNRWLYVGNLYPAQKDLGRFFSILDDAIREDGLDFEWRFLGSNHYGCLNEWMEKYPLVAQRCKVYAWQSRKEVLEHYTWSNGCIHFRYVGAEGIPSAKRNEYAVSGRKVLNFSNQTKLEVLAWAELTDFPPVAVELFREALVGTWIQKHFR